MSDDNFYRLENVPSFEAIYGKGLISLGGFQAVDEMMAGLEVGRKELLDIGFGIGGMAHYLAAEYDARVWGLEIHEWMVTFARHATPAAIRNNVEFLTYDRNGNIPLSDACIDLAYSKGVLTNVEDKQCLFGEVARVLRPGGRICLIDWLAPAGTGKTSERLLLGDLSHRETALSYQELLTACGFSAIEIQDLSPSYLAYVRALRARLEDNEHIARYGDVLSDRLRQDIIASHASTAQAIENHTQLSCRILATYP